MLSNEDTLWTLDDCDDADLSPETKRSLGIHSDEDFDETSGVRARSDVAPHTMNESGEVPSMSDAEARELLVNFRISAA
jgi:hypothetical protein